MLCVHSKERVVSANIGNSTAKILVMKRERERERDAPMKEYSFAFTMAACRSRKLIIKTFEEQRYADDLIVSIRAKRDGLILFNMQNDLHISCFWHLQEKLNINPHKIAVVPFTKIRRLFLVTPTLEEPKTF